MNSAFFYPYVHFKSRDWLKSALLYYDDIVRIVSPKVNPDTAEEYSKFHGDPLLVDDIAQLKTAGFIRDEAPSPSQLTKAAETFIDFAGQSLLTSGDRERILPAFRSASSVVRLNPANLAPELVDILRESKLANQNVNDKYSTIEVETVTAIAYATLLATELAGSRDMVTDDSIYHRMLLQTNQAKNSDDGVSADDKALRVAALAFESVGFSSGVSIPTILKFREKHSEDRARFSEAVRKLTASLKSEPTAESVRNCVSSLTDSLESLKDKLKSQQVTFAGSIFSVSAPAWLTAAWGLGVTGPVVIGGALALGLSIGSVKHFYDRRAIRRENPYTYLLEVSKSFSYPEMARLMVEPLPFDNLEYRDYAVPSM